MSDQSLPMPSELTQPTQADTRIVAGLTEMSSYIGNILKEGNTILRDNSKELDTMSKEVSVNNKNEWEVRKNLMSSFKKIAGSMGEGLGKIGTKIGKTLEPLKEGMTKGFDESFNALLGPLQLITRPLESFTGKKFSDILNPFNKKFKGTLKRNKIKDIDPGAVYLADKLTGGKDKKKDDKLSNLFSKMGLLGGLGKAIGLGASIALIAGGLIWMAIDAIKGMFKAKEWGVSKTSAGIASALAGTGSDWENAFKNAGKWAMIGAGAGFLAGGIVGAIAGGLIGGAIGLVLGYIGGEKFAKDFENKFAIHDIITDKEISKTEKVARVTASTFFGKFSIFTKAGWVNSLTGWGQQFAKLGKWFADIGVATGKWFANIGIGIANWFKGIVRSVSFEIWFFKKTWKMRVKKFKKFLDKIGSAFVNLPKDILESVVNRISSFKNSVMSIGSFIYDIIDKVKDNIANIFTQGMNQLKDNPFTNFVKDMIGSIIDFFKPMLQYFEYAGGVLKDKPIMGIKVLAKDIGSGGKGFEQFQNFKGLEESINTGQGSREIQAEMQRLEKSGGLDKASIDKLNEMLNNLDITINKYKPTTNVISTGGGVEINSKDFTGLSKNKKVDLSQSVSEYD